MDTQSSKVLNQTRNFRSVKEWLERIVLAVLFTVVGGLLTIVFKPWGKQFIPNQVDNYLWRIGLSILLLAAAELLRRSRRFEKYWQIAYAFFTMSVALFLTWVFGSFLFDTLNVSDSAPYGWALPKLNESVLIILVIVACTRLSGQNLGSIYLQKGNLKLGLILGCATFAAAAALSVPMANLLFDAKNLTLERIIPWIPWLLIFVLANAAMEELLFRGLFLRKLQPFLGKFFSNFLIAFVFTILHKGSSYTSDELIFLAATFPLALLWGYIMQKTDAVWASILFHAGMDIPIILGIFSGLA